MRITVRVPQGVYADLEEALQRAYGLKEAIIVDAVDADGGDQLLRDLGAAAAFYVETTLKPRSHRHLVVERDAASDGECDAAGGTTKRGVCGTAIGPGSRWRRRDR